ncbi:Signal transduction histidine kinase (fragment) [Hyella patelloides LEGE 07179]|uniref:histidine kinase n=1 Tax=Hyella patelloides LEGE 07179 TaxID=945734 RepID=A0A563VJL5_9CYAN
MLDLINQEAFGDVTCEQQEAVANIVSSNDNMLEMLNTLLETHHYELGQKILSFIPVALQPLIKEVVTELQSLAIEKGIELKSNIADGIDEIKGDRLELRRVITNLVGNAIKFTDIGSVQVSLSQNDSEVVLQVTDSGIGISAREQQAIFQRYHQGNHRRSGKGLGLYLCQQIIHAHGGKITVQSELGKGTTFVISIPKS